MDIIGTLNQILVFLTAVAIVASPFLGVAIIGYQIAKKLGNRSA